MVVVCAVLLSAPLWVLLPALVAATALLDDVERPFVHGSGRARRGARSGAALGFQQTTLSIVGVLAAPAFATLVDIASWRAGFALAALGPLAGWALLGRLPELAAQN